MTKMPWYPFPFPQVHLSCSVLLCPSTTNFLMTSKYMQFPMTQISYCLRCQSSSSPALPFLVLLQAAVPLWCPSKFLDDADQASYHLLSCLYSVGVSSRFLCQALVTFKYTSCWRRYQILALYYCCLRVGVLLLLPCTMQQKNLLTSKLPDINSMQCNNNGTGETIKKYHPRWRCSTAPLVKIRLSNKKRFKRTEKM